MDPSAVAAPELPAVNDVTAVGDFELFFDAQVEPEKHMAYILMMATDYMIDFSIKSTHPYCEFMSNRKLGGGGWVRKLSANKDIVVQELMRRDPNAKPNKSNRSCEELLRLFKPLTDRRDIEFIIKKELEIRQKLEAILGELNTKRTGHDLREKTPKRPKIEKNIDLAAVAANNIKNYLKLDDTAASVAVEAAEKSAKENGYKVSIAIVNSDGEPMVVKRLDGSNTHSFDLALTKAKAASQFHRNTSQLQDFPDVSRGGVPLVANGSCIGGVGVSGDKQPNCEKVAYAAIDKLMDLAKQAALAAVPIVQTETSV